MARELETAIQAGLSLLRTINGLRSAPDYSPENPSAFPLLVGSASEGTYVKESSGSVRGLHTVKFGIYKPRNDLPRDVQTMMPFGDLLKDVFFADDTTNASATWSGTITGLDEKPISYTFGELEYMPGVVLIGWTILVPIKIRSRWDGAKYVKG